MEGARRDEAPAGGDLPGHARRGELRSPARGTGPRLSLRLHRIERSPIHRGQLRLRLGAAREAHGDLSRPGAAPHLRRDGAHRTRLSPWRALDGGGGGNAGGRRSSPWKCAAAPRSSASISTWTASAYARSTRNRSSSSAISRGRPRAHLASTTTTFMCCKRTATRPGRRRSGSAETEPATHGRSGTARDRGATGQCGAASHGRALLRRAALRAVLLAAAVSLVAHDRRRLHGLPHTTSAGALLLAAHGGASPCSSRTSAAGIRRAR